MQQSVSRGDGYDAGDVVYETWGYDQTNVDFYRVERRSEKDTVWLRRMTAEHVPGSEVSHGMADRVRPGEVVADAPLVRRRLVRYGEDNAVHGLQVNGHGWARSWEGRPEGTYRSWYA